MSPEAGSTIIRPLIVLVGALVVALVLVATVVPEGTARVAIFWLLTTAVGISLGILWIQSERRDVLLRRRDRF